MSIKHMEGLPPMPQTHGPKKKRRGRAELVSKPKEKQNRAGRCEPES